jgi:Ni/Co efflux regulator RcnB
MKTLSPILCALTVVLLVGLTTLACAQEDSMRKRLEAYLTPAGQQERRETTRRAMRVYWDNSRPEILARHVDNYEDLREGIGISPEQYQIIQDARVIQTTQDGQVISNYPVISAIHNEISEFTAKHPGVQYGENVTEETRKKYFELMEKNQEAMKEVITNSVINNLTPDQLEKVKEFHISIMSEGMYVSPGMFEILNLSDEQKKQLDEIKKEMESEFEKHVDIVTELGLIFAEKTLNELNKLDSETMQMQGNQIEQMKILEEVQDKIRKSDAEVKQMEGKLLNFSKALANKLKIKMFDVLTDAQWDRMTDLIDNPPEYVKKLMRKKYGDDEPGGWQPGPNSWRPGDPIPEQYRQEREERRTKHRPGFPRGESQ